MVELYLLIILFGIGCFIVGWGSRQDRIDFLESDIDYLEDQLYGGDNH